MNDKTDSIPKGNGRNCRGIHMPGTGLAAVGGSDDHYRTEDINHASAKRLEIGSAPASTALALFVASTGLTRPYCEHRDVDATSVKFSHVAFTPAIWSPVIIA